MTQQDLADAAGVDLKTVYNLESGSRWPIARTRVAISRALGWGGDGLARLVAAAEQETSALDPAIVKFIRDMGLDSDPFLAESAAEVHELVKQAGEGASGIEVFREEADAVVFSIIWDAPGPNAETKIAAIATLLADRKRRDAARYSNHSARGTAGLALVTLAAR